MMFFESFLWSFIPADTTTVLSHSPNTKLLISEGEDVTINCSHGGTVYEVSVERMEGVDGGSRVLAVCKQDGVEIRDYLHRGNVNCSDEMEMQLHLNNVSQDDGGIYRCSFRTDAGFSSRLIWLAMSHSPKGLQPHDTITLPEHRCRPSAKCLVSELSFLSLTLELQG